MNTGDDDWTAVVLRCGGIRLLALQNASTVENDVVSKSNNEIDVGDIFMLFFDLSHFDSDCSNPAKQDKITRHKEENVWICY